MTNDGGYAFPVPMVYDGAAVESVNERGMSLRDYFAAQAIVGVIATKHPSVDLLSHVDVAAKVAYAVADAMLAERGKTG